MVAAKNMIKKSVLVIGSGGREHALGWKLSKSPKVGRIYFTPGNAGTSQIGKNIAISAHDVKALLDFAVNNKIDLTVVGPDDALALGVVDAFQKKGFTIFGPTRQAAKLEWSKAFAKKFMAEEGIPTASYASFTDINKAKSYLKQQKTPIVIKASGLALGKGVIIAKTQKEAEKTIEDIMIKKIFGDAGSEIIIEEFLEGKEISIHAICDGTNVSIFPASRDHKRLFDGNHGPNTGGMGTIAPLNNITKEELGKITRKIVLPVIKGMKKRGKPFTGILYPGLMITKNGPKVLEFNARFGDPETQSYMRLLKTDLFDILVSAAKGRLSDVTIEWENKYACCIILASGGYPGAYKKGEVIHGVIEAEKDKDIVVFHAGTINCNHEICSNGGRVLGLTTTGNTLESALSKAYSLIGTSGIHFAKMQYRHDIGKI